MSSDLYFSRLIKIGGRLLENKNLQAVDFYKKGLMIKHKDKGIEYTVSKVVKKDGEEPYLICYMYRENPDNPAGKVQKIYTRIPTLDDAGNVIDDIKDFEVV